MSTAGDLLDKALKLPQSQRAALVHQLLLSLEPEDFDADCQALWAAELEARAAGWPGQ